MTGVRYSSPTNSTLFTDCCSVAVCDDETCCPVCGSEVYPKDPRSRHREALRQQMGAGAYAEHRKRMDQLIREDRRQNALREAEERMKNPA